MFWNINPGSVIVYLGISWVIIRTSSNWKIFRVTGLLCGEYTGHRYPAICAWSAQLKYVMTSWNGNLFPCYWPFVRGIRRSPVNSPHKGQWLGALMFSLICGWTNGWANNRDSGDLRRHRAHYISGRHLILLCVSTFSLNHSLRWRKFA